jgi:predicted amidohydrolase
MCDQGRTVTRDLLVREAVGAGASIVALPEFFTTGAVFDDKVARSSLTPDAGTGFLSGLSKELGIHLGGSFLCRDDDGHTRNAYVLTGPDGDVLGRHDKDLPTMWENALYVGGTDDGVIDAGPFTVGAAVCWEFMRTQTVRRLAGRVDVVLGGSNWWSIPKWPPKGLSRRLEARNAATARLAPSVFGRFVGAPVVHGAITGRFACPMPELQAVTYRGKFQGGALVATADGAVLGVREQGEGSGVVVADVQIGRSTPLDAAPDRFWLHRRDPLSVYAWHVHRAYGRRWYDRHVRVSA